MLVEDNPLLATIEVPVAIPSLETLAVRMSKVPSPAVVPPIATPFNEPPVIATDEAFCVDIVPRPLT